MVTFRARRREGRRAPDGSAAALSAGAPRGADDAVPEHLADPEATATPSVEHAAAATGSLRARSAAGVLWTAAAIWSVRISSTATFIILGRQLQPAEFGLVALASGVIAILTTISDSGFATYVVRQHRLDDATRHTAFWTSLGLSVVLAGVVLALADVVAGWFGEPGLGVVLRWLTVGLVLAGLNSLPTALLRRDMKFKMLAARGITASFAGSVVAVVLALLGGGVWSLVAQSLTVPAVSLVMLWAAVDYRPRLRFAPSKAREMASFGSKLLGIDLMVQARDRGEEFVLGATAAAATLGYWSVATRLIKVIQDTGSQVVSAVATPAFAKLQDDPARLYRAYGTSMAATGMVIFPAMLLLAATSPDVVPLVLGEQWTQTSLVAQITAVTAAVGVFSYFDRTMFVAVDRLRPELALVAFVVVSHLAVVLITAPFGLRALAVGLLVRTVVTFPVRQVVLHRVVGVPYRCLLAPFRVFLAASLMAGAVLGVQALADPDGRVARVLVALAVAVVVYPLAMLLVARPTTLEMVNEVRSALRRRTPRAKPTSPVVVEGAAPAASSGARG